MDNTPDAPHFKRFFKETSASFFLLGPRGTGKTTWLRRHYKNAIWIDLLDPEEFRYYSARPERLRETIEAHPEKKSIVIDEIQRIPELLPLIHSLIEERKELQFILTGSSARKLKNKGVNLLGGRAGILHMHPFFAAEIAEAFTLKKALQIGMLPLIWSSPTPLDLLNGYTGLYLQEEVRAEGAVRNVGDFARFLEVISFSHASLVNITNIARECDTSRKTVESYIQILKDLLLAFEIPVFTRRAKRATVAHSKLYLCDAGIYRTLRPMGPVDKVEEVQGAALEGLIAQHLRAWIDYQKEKYSLTFWRTRTGLEVDFIVYGPKGLWAIEVKNSDHIAPKEVKPLLTFCEEYPEATPLVLYQGRRRVIVKGVLCIPCSEFLLQLRPENTLWPSASI